VGAGGIMEPMSTVGRDGATGLAGPPVQRLLGFVLAGALATAVLLPPARVESGPVLCPFRLLTGLPCPTCGLTRSWVHTAHGDLAAAIADHPVGPLVLLLAVVALGWLIATRGRAAYPPWLRRFGALTLGLTAAVGLTRLVVALV
jgi:Protein of unknown function (DUF2752)